MLGKKLGNFGHSVVSQCSTTTQYSSVTIQSLAATEPLSVSPDSGKVCIVFLEVDLLGR